MAVIYDETLAIQRKREVDDALPGENRKTIIHNVIWTIGVILGVALFGVLTYWCVFELYKEIEYAVMASLVSMVILLLIGCLILEFEFEPMQEAGEYYDALILYYVAVDGKTVLEHALSNNGSNTYRLVLTLEDENHIVTKQKLAYDLRKKVRTDISEVTVDLAKGIVYFPYKDEDEIGEQD